MDAHKSNPVLELLDREGAIYPGGYALALYNGLLNPTKAGHEQVSKALYGDIDVMSRIPGGTKELAALVEKSFTINKRYETSRAITLWVNTLAGEQVFQFVTWWGHDPILALNHFDYDNCKIAFDPVRGFLVHETTDRLLSTKTLGLSDDWEEQDEVNILSLTIPRALKYCQRWDWRLDAVGIQRLTGCWLALPEAERWEPPAEIDSARCAISNEPTADNLDAIGLSLQKLYELHNIDLLPEMVNTITEAEELTF